MEIKKFEEFTQINEYAGDIGEPVMLYPGDQIHLKSGKGATVTDVYKASSDRSGKIQTRVGIIDISNIDAYTPQDNYDMTVYVEVNNGMLVVTDKKEDVWR